MTGVQTCALPICFPVTIEALDRTYGARIQAERLSFYGDRNKRRLPRYSVAQSILYATGFGTSTSQVPAQWTFSGDNMTINNIGPSSGYPGASGGVYFSEGNHKGFLNTNGVYVYCSQPGTSSATLIVSTAGHTDIELMFGMCKSGAGYNTAVNYSPLIS